MDVCCMLTLRDPEHVRNVHKNARFGQCKAAPLEDQWQPLNTFVAFVPL